MFWGLPLDSLSVTKLSLTSRDAQEHTHAVFIKAHSFSLSFFLLHAGLYVGAGGARVLRRTHATRAAIRRDVGDAFASTLRAALFFALPHLTVRTHCLEHHKTGEAEPLRERKGMSFFEPAPAALSALPEKKEQVRFLF